MPFFNLSLIATSCCNSSTFLFNAVISSSFSVATFSLKIYIKYKTKGGAHLFSRTLCQAQTEKDKTSVDRLLSLKAYITFTQERMIHPVF